MKKIIYFSLPMCIPCVETSRWITEVMYEHAEYEKVDLEMIDVSKNWEKAKEYNLESAPAFYLDGEKYCEGEATKEIVEQVFKAAYEG